jgi:hypothetical protein
MILVELGLRMCLVNLVHFTCAIERRRKIAHRSYEVSGNARVSETTTTRSAN